jgi:hypothetical protein
LDVPQTFWGKQVMVRALATDFTGVLPLDETSADLPLKVVL